MKKFLKAAAACLLVAGVGAGLLTLMWNRQQNRVKTGAGNISQEAASRTDSLFEDTHQTEYVRETEAETEDLEGMLVEEDTNAQGQSEASDIVQETFTVTTGRTSSQESELAGAVSGLSMQPEEDAAAGQDHPEPAPSGQPDQAVSGTSQSENHSGPAPFGQGGENAAGTGQSEAGAQNLNKSPVEGMLDTVSRREALGEKWAIAWEDLNDSSRTAYGYHDSEQMQSASVIKLFIMGAVYQYMCYPKDDSEMIDFGESYDGELRDTINAMITVSDNSAANLLVEKLGRGDFNAGKEVVNKFCQENGYTGTSLGRRFMASSLAEGDNYTAAADVRKFYSDVWHGDLVDPDASAKMLEIIKGQTLRNKIPAGLPQGFTSGNKTGEMPDGYGLGCIENDSAIVFAPEDKGGYILVILSNDLGGKNSEAISAITQLSSRAADWYLSH